MLLKDDMVFSIEEEKGANKNNRDIARVLKVLWRKLWMLIIFAILGGGIGFMYADMMVTPLYRADTSIYVVNAQNVEGSLTYADLQSGEKLINDCKRLIMDESIMRETIENLNIPYSVAQLRDMVWVSIPTETRFLDISASSSSPQEAQAIVNMICEISVGKIREYMGVEKVNIVHQAEVPTKPYAPNVARYVQMGAAACALLVGLSLMLISIADDRLKDLEEIEKSLGVSLLGSIPECPELNDDKKKNKFADVKRKGRKRNVSFRYKKNKSGKF